MLLGCMAHMASRIFIPGQVFERQNTNHKDQKHESKQNNTSRVKADDKY